ncbi:ABC transporter ATP-binding protein [Kineococcus sp. SYSU DK002]|uniref:ABC transporter ATP-binding protein n=1 Tax=Kineococcus sp. SYSU DK002 TaxID=3383123 RepID=UPI003D7E1135
MTAVVHATGVQKSFGNHPALRGVDLLARPGEIVAITGPSGSGKSTLLHCLAGIVRADRGSITVAGHQLDAIGEEERSKLRRNEIGVLMQFGHLVAELTALQNVALPLLLRGESRASAAQRARTWLDRFAVGDLADRRPTQVSGGQAQRVAAARALVTEPAVLMADEPTGALDSLAGEELMAQVTLAARARGTTVLLVTHDARVAAHADREVVVRDGLVVGPPRARGAGGPSVTAEGPVAPGSPA